MTTTHEILIRTYQLKALEGEVCGKTMLLDILRQPGPAGYGVGEAVQASRLMALILEANPRTGHVLLSSADADFLCGKINTYRFTMADPVLVNFIADITPSRVPDPPETRGEAQGEVLSVSDPPWVPPAASDPPEAS